MLGSRADGGLCVVCDLQVDGTVYRYLYHIYICYCGCNRLPVHIYVIVDVTVDRYMYHIYIFLV
jgi:hypothetical protein